jgi:hypothetical protein
MEQPDLSNKRMKAALCQFIFPISLNRNSQREMKKLLTHDGFVPFYLDNLELEDAFYGEGYRVSHRNMERYYLPFTNSFLFPHKENEAAFQRYSKASGITCDVQTEFCRFQTVIHSVDVILCPFDLCFITLRTQLKGEVTYTEAIEFANRFRVLQKISDEDEKTRVHVGGKEYAEIEEFIFSELVPGLLPYLDKSEMQATYFEKLPFFVDERMFVQSFYWFGEDEQINESDLYRASRIDGLNRKGEPFIGARNMEYIHAYCTKHAYDRWAPNTYYITDETSFNCLTNQEDNMGHYLANQMYGEYYYGLLINLFHKIVLLKLSNRYSGVQLEQNQDEIEDLIRDITTFSAKYYFLEVVSQSQGKEIFLVLRKMLESNELYEDVKQTLTDLYKYQANFTTKQSGYLLLILTIYTVISGIYGMNLVIGDLKGHFQWSIIMEYSVFEYLALVVTISGIVIALGLGISTISRMVRDFGRRKQRKY